MKRFFSSGSAVAREFAHRVNARVPRRQQPVYAGDAVTALAGARQQVPPYPYGPARQFKRSDRGLYGGRMLQFGHQISEFGNKHVRIFEPNVQKVKLWSDALQRHFQVRAVAAVLKTITREGGLDKYVTKDTPMRIKALGRWGWELRYHVLTRHGERERTQPKAVGATGAGRSVFAVVDREGVPTNVLAGRTRLIKLLFEAEDRPTPYRPFLLAHRGDTFEELLAALEARGADLAPWLEAVAPAEDAAEAATGADPDAAPAGGPGPA